VFEGAITQEFWAVKFDVPRSMGEKRERPRIHLKTDGNKTTKKPLQPYQAYDAYFGLQKAMAVIKI